MTYWLFRLATGLAPLLPIQLGYWLSARVGDLAFLLSRRSRHQYIKNLRHVVGDPVGQPQLRRLARKGFENLCKNYFDLFRSRALSSEDIRAQLAELSGFEHIEAALGEGKGVIGGSAHFGNFNLFVHIGAVYLKEKHRVVLPVERLKPAQLFEFVRRLRASQGIEVIPVDTSTRTLIRALQAGDMIALALDYDAQRKGPPVTFFDCPAPLPEGAVALSLHYGSPLVMAFIRRLDDNRSAVVVEPPLHFAVTGDRTADLQRGQRQVAAILEKWITRYPDQWLMLQQVWEDDLQG